MISYPVISMGFAKLMMKFIVILHKNQELIETIKHILEVFPEAVIIRGFDKEKEKVTELFINLVAQWNKISQQELDEKSTKFIINKSINKNN